MKKYSTLLVVVITILVVALLSWIFPVTYLSGELVSAERAQAGLISLISYPTFTYYNFIYAFLYLSGIGALYGLLNKTGAYYNMLSKITNHVKGREIIWLILTVLFISIICSFTGFTFEMLIILPLIAGVILMLGYDKMTAAMVTVGSVAVGIIGTTYSKLVAGTFNNMLDTNYKDLIIIKVILLILCAALLILNIILYTKKIEKNKNADEDFLIPEKTNAKDVKTWPLVVILSVFMILLIVGTIDWNGAFGIEFFDNLHTKFLEKHVLSKYIVAAVSFLVVLYNVGISIYYKKKYGKGQNAISSFFKRAFSKKKNGKFMSTGRLIVTICFGVFFVLSFAKIMLESVFNVTNIIERGLELIKVNGLVEAFTFSKLLGNYNAIGAWGYNDYLPALIILVFVIKFAYHIKFTDALDNMGVGIKKVLLATTVVMLGYTVLIVTSSHPVILTILKPLLNLTDGLSIIWYPICTFVSALANSDFTYYQYGVLNLSYATTYFTSTNVYPLCELITQTMYGLALFVAPTSSVLLFTLGLFEIRYTTWLKKMWLTIIEIAALIFASYVVVLQFMV